MDGFEDGLFNSSSSSPYFSMYEQGFASDQTLESALSGLNIGSRNERLPFVCNNGGAGDHGNGMHILGSLYRQNDVDFQRITGNNFGGLGRLNVNERGTVSSYPCLINDRREESSDLYDVPLMGSGRFQQRGRLYEENQISPFFNLNRLSSSSSSSDYTGSSFAVMNSQVNNKRDPLMASVNNRKEPLQNLSLDHPLENIVILAKDQCGCRFLQKIMENLKREEIDIIFREIIDHVDDLMVHSFGNYVVQKIIELCSEKQRTDIIFALVTPEYKLVSICLNTHGTRAVQKLLEHLTSEVQVSMVMKALRSGVVPLTKSPNGHHVIQHCLKRFPGKANEFLLIEVANNCFGIATDKSGCCVLQLCVDCSHGELREYLVGQIIANALPLAEHRYGNYVLQHLLELGMPKINANILRQLAGNYLSLSCDKYGSNVVEKSLKSGEENSSKIIKELLRSPDVSNLLLDPYGNYVIQSALSISKGFIQKALIQLVRTHWQMMRSNLYGRKILDWLEKRKMQYM